MTCVPRLEADMDPGPEDEERLLQRSMVGHIERCLSEAKSSALCCQVLLVPCQMTAKVARDMALCSAGEPCGLRGAFIMVYLEEDEEEAGRKDGPVLKPLGVIRPDPTVTPTFELSVVLKADRGGWSSPLRRVFVGEVAVKLRSGYRLVKRKLYSSENPVVHCFY